MDIRTKTILLWSGMAVLVIAGIVILILSFGRSKDTTTGDINTAYTNAASTVAAQQQTLQAGVFSATPNPALSSPTATLASLPSPTLAQQTPILIPTSTLAGGGVTGCDNSVYLSDVTIPDGTVVTPGQTFTKTWRVSNTGTCAWTANYQIIFIAGDGMSGKATAIGKAVNPGESVDISVALTAPATAGNTTGTWRLSNDKSQPFGTMLTVVITSGTSGTASATQTGITATFTVVSSTVTPTFTPTITSTSEIVIPTETASPAVTP